MVIGNSGKIERRHESRGEEKRLERLERRRYLVVLSILAIPCPRISFPSPTTPKVIYLHKFTKNTQGPTAY